MGPRPHGRPLAGARPPGWPRLFRRAWPRVCVGYVTDAIGPSPAGPGTGWRPAPSSTLAQGQAEAPRAQGQSEEYRLNTPQMAGAALVTPEASGPPHGRFLSRKRWDGPGGESVRTHGDTGRNRLRVILSHVPRGNQFARQWQLLQIDHPAGIAIEVVARELGCTVRTIWRDLQVLRRPASPSTT
jgi:hypothetical protein